MFTRRRVVRDVFDTFIQKERQMTHESSRLANCRLVCIAVLLILVLIGLPVMTSSASADACSNEALREAQQSAFLPDCRAYELVSPPDKNGGDVMISAPRTRAAADETAALPMAVSFASFTGFGDVRGSGVATEYLSERDGQPGTTGWSTHGITPQQSPLSIFAQAQFLDPMYDGDFSADLTHGVFRSFSTLVPTGNTQEDENLYTRNDLRTAGAGSYQLLSDSFTPLGSSIVKPAFAGASADFSHVVFESDLQLTPDAGACTPDFFGGGCAPNLYESVNGVVRLIGILPDGQPAATGCPNGLPCSIAGRGASFPIQRYTRHVISSDGSKVLFSSPTSPIGDLTDSSTSGPEASKVYMRDDHGTLDTADDTTIQLNASERTDCAEDPTCGGDGVPDPAPATARPATPWDASTDLSRVFFTSAEALTDSAPNTADSSHLYMWSAAAPAGHHLTMLDVDKNSADLPAGVPGVIGASADGHYVYFVDDGQLVAGAPAVDGGAAIDVWHDDGTAPQVDYVGQFVHNAALDENVDVPTAWLSNPIEARVTPDGRHLLFAASDGEGLTGYDQTACSHGCRELYVYSAQSRELACASCMPSGAPATVNATDNVRGGATGPVTTYHVNRAISNNGRYVFFSTGEALVPQDTNGRSDVYEFDGADGTVHLLSSGQGTSDAYFADASADGRDVFFVTRQQLTGWDTDENYDLYDVRVAGGLPGPAVPVPACEGDACRGSASATPGAGGSTTQLFSGAGNLVAPAVKPPVVKRVSNAQRLRRALQACKKKPRHARRRCESKARKRYVSKSSRRSK
jgi:hypothetical protein